MKLVYRNLAFSFKEILISKPDSKRLNEPDHRNRQKMRTSFKSYLLEFE